MLRLLYHILVMNNTTTTTTTAAAAATTTTTTTTTNTTTTTTTTTTITITGGEGTGPPLPVERLLPVSVKKTLLSLAPRPCDPAHVGI